VSEKLRSAEDVANETIFDVDIAKALQGDYIAAFRHAIEADRLAVAEAVREACAAKVRQMLKQYDRTLLQGLVHELLLGLRAIDLGEILKG